MRWAIVTLLFLASCMPYGPTGYATISSYSLEGEDLIQVDVRDSPIEVAPVVISVYGDAVLDRILVNGEKYKLGGQSLQGLWLQNKGSTALHLPPGEHEILAYSCQEAAFSWECGCLEEDNCGHWFKKTFTVG